MFGASVNDKHACKEQLLKLYWNRASVKRELKSLQNERHVLLEQLKDSEGAIARAREQLDGLERLLVNPIAAANAMVYFQMRNIWRVASVRLDEFAGELEENRQQKERRALQDAALSKRRRRLAAIEENLNTLHCERTVLADKADNLQVSLEEMNFLVRLFRQRKVRAELEVTQSEIASLIEQAEELREAGEKLEGEPLPELEQLSIEGRRFVNTAIIALAQHLVVHFSANKLAETAREAMHRTVGDMRFGDRRECDRMVEHIRSRIADLKEETNLAAIVKSRVETISSSLSYAKDTDTIPTVFSLQQVPQVTGEGHNRRRSTDVPIDVNVLVDDYWDISRYLI